MAKRTQPERLLDGTLTVRVPSSTWAQELSLLSEEVRQGLLASGHRVQRLRFRVSTSSFGLPAVATTVRRAPLPSELSKRLDRMTDRELRDSIAAAAAYSLGRSSTRQR